MLTEKHFYSWKSILNKKTTIMNIYTRFLIQNTFACYRLYEKRILFYSAWMVSILKFYFYSSNCIIRWFFVSAAASVQFEILLIREKTNSVHIPDLYGIFQFATLSRAKKKSANNRSKWECKSFKKSSAFVEMGKEKNCAEYFVQCAKSWCSS